MGQAAEPKLIVFSQSKLGELGEMVKAEIVLDLATARKSVIDGQKVIIVSAAPYPGILSLPGSGSAIMATQRRR